MNKMFRKLPLPAKLMLIALIPLVLLVFFAIQIYREKTEKIGTIESYIGRIDQSVNITTLIDELQTERRYSFGYAINRDWRAEMVVQRPRTDSAMQKALSNDQMQHAASYTFLDSLQAIRYGIDNARLSPQEVINYYTNVIFRLNAMNIVSAGTIRYLAPLRGELAAQKLLSEMVTYLGRIRANIYYSLYTGQSSAQTLDGIKSVHDIYKSYEREFIVKVSPKMVDDFKAVSASQNVRATTDYVNYLLTTSKFDTTYSAEEWWQISANAIDELKKLQRSASDAVLNGVNGIYKKEEALRDKSLFFLLLTIVLVIGVVLYTIKIITKTLSELNEAAQKISRGVTGVAVPVESDDVIGNLAESIIRIDQSNKGLSQAAESIGKGNFNVDVAMRSEEDILGNALLHMKNDLKRFNRENEEKLWIHTGIEKINESIRGEKKVEEVASDALEALTSYVNGEVGLLYVGYVSYLQYKAGYAVENTNAIPAQIAFGETLVGQAAQKKEVLQLNTVPDNFIKIKSGSGEASPKNILIVPLMHNDVVEGVAEIGSLGAFSHMVVSFISQAAPIIGVALQAAKSREKLQELFEQTQSQAEELQAQHSELENINAELEAQTEKLQASEEELKVQQEELLQANQELEERSRLLEERNQLIVERNLEIQQKAEELALSTKYKSEFLANMSHELRTPLNSVLLLSRLLSENNEKNLTPDQVEYAQVIQSSGQGLLSLIDEILDLSKIEAGKMDLEYHPVMIQEIVNDMRALFLPMAKEKGLEFTITVEEKLPSQIEIDKMRLEQVLKNLLSNALKFTAKGSVQLNISTLKENNSFVAFSVKDTGIGIPEDKQGLVFEAFQQADGSTRRKYGGTGLGLSISRELVRLLGGEIKLSSKAGKGSEFTVYIPINKTAANQKTPAAPQDAKKEEVPILPSKTGFRAEKIPEQLPDDRQQVGIQDKTILIIEDDTAFAKALLEFTHQKGYKGLVAVRGDEGIALARQYKPVGILLDIQLPVKDGWEVMEELKSNPATRHIPVHIMSSFEVKRESLIKGAVDFINKPVAFDQMQEVFQKIEQVLNKEHKKVLIVEENPKHAKALGYFLETFNVKTEISGSVKVGMDALKKEEVDCVILDMGIPDQQAYETLEEVKKRPGLENLPIIIFTGKNLSKTEELRIKQYADSIVIKTAHSYQRILDEVSLFLHLVEESNQTEKSSIKYKRLGALNEVLAGKKILVADDDVRNIYSLTKALEIHNMKVITAVDGKEALRQLEEHSDTNVVLMDIMMPEMDGYEAMQRIRQNNGFKRLPIIAVTAKAMTGDREKCIQAGASDYISKPVDIDQLLSLLRVWLYDKSM